jgi:hypothetical protein
MSGYQEYSIHWSSKSLQARVRHLHPPSQALLLSSSFHLCLLPPLLPELLLLDSAAILYYPHPTPTDVCTLMPKMIDSSRCIWRLPGIQFLSALSTLERQLIEELASVCLPSLDHPLSSTSLSQQLVLQQMLSCILAVAKKGVSRCYRSVLRSVTAYFHAVQAALLSLWSIVPRRKSACMFSSTHTWLASLLSRMCLIACASRVGCEGLTHAAPSHPSNTFTPSYVGSVHTNEYLYIFFSQFASVAACERLEQEPFRTVYSLFPLLHNLLLGRGTKICRVLCVVTALLPL